MRTRLTEKAVEKFAPVAGKRLEVFDTYLPGLALRVTEQGSKSWSIMYRVAGEGERNNRGKLRRLTLGQYPLLDLKTARERARLALDSADRGDDPAVKRESEFERRARGTVARVVVDYIETYAKRHQKEWRAGERLLEAHVVPAWGDRQLDGIRRKDVRQLLSLVSSEVARSSASAAAKRGKPFTPERAELSGTSAARELRKHLSKLFNWAVDEDLMESNPMFGMRDKALKYVPRKRVLSRDELQQVWDAAGAVGYPFGTMVRLLILTGQRRSEVAELERRWLRDDLDGVELAVEIPEDRYKTGQPHVYPLSAPALAVIRDLPKWNGGDCLFTTTGGRRPVSGFSKAKARLDAKIAEAGRKAGLPEMEPWTVHDIRRSVDTHMARLGVPQEHIERVLGHVITGVAGTYNRYSYLAEKAAALELWGKQWS